MLSKQPDVFAATEREKEKEIAKKVSKHANLLISDLFQLETKMGAPCDARHVRGRNAAELGSLVGAIILGVTGVRPIVKPFVNVTGKGVCFHKSSNAGFC